jgi:hypothetical protein
MPHQDLAPRTLQSVVAELRTKATAAGDDTTLKLCDLALAGSTGARARVLQLWRNAQAASQVD